MFAGSLALALAGSALAYVPAARAEDAGVETVRRLYAGLDTAMKAGGGDPRGRVAAVGKPLAEAFDFPTMTRLAVGPRWSGLSAEQQAALTTAFAEHFGALYTSRLAQSAGGRFDVSPQSETRGETRIVHSKVVAATGEGSQVDFVLNPQNRIQDVLLNGSVSEVANQRALYAKPLKAGGVDRLLKFLRERTATLLSAPPTP